MNPAKICLAFTLLLAACGERLTREQAEDQIAARVANAVHAQLSTMRHEIRAELEQEIEQRDDALRQREEEKTFTFDPARHRVHEFDEERIKITKEGAIYVCPLQFEGGKTPMGHKCVDMRKFVVALREDEAAALKMSEWTLVKDLKLPGFKMASAQYTPGSHPELQVYWEPVGE